MSYHSNTFRLILAASSSLIIATQAVAQGPQIVYNPMPGTGTWTLLPNGDFEIPGAGGSPSGWTPWETQPRGTFQTSSTVSYSGTYSARATATTSFGPPDVVGYSNATAGIRIQANKEYVLSGFFNTEHFHFGDIYLDLGDLGAHTLDFNMGATNSTPGWQFVYQQFTLPTNTDNTDPFWTDLIRVRTVQDEYGIPGANYGYIDLVALTPADQFVAPTPIPEPALLLSVSALAMVGWRVVRKRRCAGA
jgi:hypothetical protein